uniref:Aminoglycoside phosphotransferase n=1 Tax=Ascaris lumbricoides TaxID=6252 RepID=A0A0M3HJW6_ASCLU
MLKIIEAIRKRYPEKGKISSSDILQHGRRDTIAFMPQSIEGLKFADEMDLDDSLH